MPLFGLFLGFGFVLVLWVGCGWSIVPGRVVCVVPIFRLVLGCGHAMFRLDCG